MYFVLQ